MPDELSIEVTGLDDLDRAMAQCAAEFNREAVSDGLESAVLAVPVLT